MVHTTFQYGGSDGKRTRLREAMVFADPPEYYTPARDGTEGFLSIELEWPAVPENFTHWNNSRNEEMIRVHLDGMTDQLRQVRAGMAMARALNRTFVMPKVG